MNTVTINPGLCIQCGACSDLCPTGTIGSGGPGTMPLVPPENLERCLACGHCEAVCPSGAVAVMAPRLIPSREPRGKSTVDPGLLIRYLQMRRSVRRFHKTPVDRPVIERLLDLARYAPSGMNAQPLEWIVLYDRAAIVRCADAVVVWMRGLVAAGHPLSGALGCAEIIAEHEAGEDPVFRGAPHVILAHAPADNPGATIDGALALSYLDAAAPAVGLGTCWAGFFMIATGMDQGAASSAGIAPGRAVKGALMIGRPVHSFARIPKRNRQVIDWK